MGDFNFDVLPHPHLALLPLQLGFRQLIHEPTTDYGHIYTNIPPTSIPHSGALESYYSDHKPVYANIAPPPTDSSIPAQPCD